MVLRTIIVIFHIQTADFNFISFEKVFLLRSVTFFVRNENRNGSEQNKQRRKKNKSQNYLIFFQFKMSSSISKHKSCGQTNMR